MTQSIHTKVIKIILAKVELETPVEMLYSVPELVWAQDGNRISGLLEILSRNHCQNLQPTGACID